LSQVLPEAERIRLDIDRKLAAVEQRIEVLPQPKPRRQAAAPEVAGKPTAPAVASWSRWRDFEAAASRTAEEIWKSMPTR
jgi:hypothetical protein